MKGREKRGEGERKEKWSKGKQRERERETPFLEKLGKVLFQDMHQE